MTLASHRIAAGFASAVVLIGLLSIPATSRALSATPGAIPSFCSEKATYTGTTIVWTGRGDGHSWSDAANWHPAVVPDATRAVGTYAQDYVCIGENHNGKPAKVDIAKGKFAHIAGIDLGRGAGLTVEKSRLFLGSVPGVPVVPSEVEHGSKLEIDASALGGNSPLRIAGTLRLTARQSGRHKLLTTMTSSECEYVDSKACAHSTIEPGGGRTIVEKHGHLLIDGKGFGGVELGDQRALDNSGSLTVSKAGYLIMDDGTALSDKRSSSLALDGVGGIYPGAADHHLKPASIEQSGSVAKTSSATSVVAVPVAFAKHPKVAVSGGDLVLNSAHLPHATVRRGAGYGTGTCVYSARHAGPCRSVEATTGTPQTAVVETSTESNAPEKSAIGVSLVSGGKANFHGHRLMGQPIDVVAPNKRTTASTHLFFTFSSSLQGLPSPATARVYRGNHLITRCAVHGLTATNRSCLYIAKTVHTRGSKGRNLSLFVISIQPKARWRVT